ncbi:MAG: hypothetical protein C0514_01535 [Candidatus Puniceispirillum sp.]|nr:hypothetical protein [Candidatus Puniceispirillum sp.]
MTHKNPFGASTGRTSLNIEKEDAVLILKKEGELDFIFPEMEEDFVPENALMAAAMAYALEDDDLYEKIRNAFLASMYPHLAYGAKNDNSDKVSRN